MFDLNIPKQIATGGESAGLDQSAFTVEKRGVGGGHIKGTSWKCTAANMCVARGKKRQDYCSVCVCVCEGGTKVCT